MNLTIKPEVEMFEYRHKKFDQAKRLKGDEETEPDVEIISITTSPTHNTPSLCGRKRKLLQRSDTPYSISSESSSSCEFLQFGDRTSTPMTGAKRRKLWPTLQQKEQGSRHDDSGIGMTPQKSLLNHNGHLGRNMLHNSPATPKLRYLHRLNGGIATPTSRIRFHSGSEIDTGSSTPPLMAMRTMTPITQVTPITPVKPMTPITPITQVTPMTPVTPLTPVAPITQVTPMTPLSLITPSPSTTATTTPTPPPPPAAVLPKISDDTLRSICKYHGNMVRKFPKKERTPKDQERRNKNTIACRMSRRVKKLEQLAIEEQYRDFSQQHLNIVEKSMRSAAYLQQLMNLIAVGDCDEASSSSSNSNSNSNNNNHYSSRNINGESHNNADKKPFQLGVKKSFSIAYLTGAQDN